MPIGSRAGAVGLWLAVLGCQTTVEPPRPVAPSTPAPPSGEPERASLDPLSTEVLAVMDEAADPCVDFYRYACGQWLDETPQPADEPVYGRFHELHERNLAVMRAILEDAAADPQAAGEAGQLGRFYASCMDEAGVETAGLRSIGPLLAEIDAASTPAAAMVVVAELHALESDALFDDQAQPAYDDPSINVAHLGQGGLGLPDRSYYLDEGAEADALREAYVEHVAFMLEASYAELGTPVSAELPGLAAKVVALETELARASEPRDELRDPEAQRNPMRRAALARLVPELPWAVYFDAAGHPEAPALNVAPRA